MTKNRNGRGFWQPEWRSVVRNVPSEEWPKVWTAPSPPQPISDWREEMKSQKQTVLESSRKPLNGHRYPGKRRKPPQERFSDLSVPRSSWLTAARTGEGHRRSRSVTDNNAGRMS